MSDGIRRRGRKGSEEMEVQETDIDAYDQGSEVPPPPSYNDAVALGLVKKETNIDDISLSDDNHSVSYIDDEDDLPEASNHVKPSAPDQDRGSGGDGDELEGATGGAAASQIEERRHYELKRMRQLSMEEAKDEIDLEQIEMMDVQSEPQRHVRLDTLDIGRYSPRNSSIGASTVRDEQDAEANEPSRKRRLLESSNTKKLIFVFAVLFVAGLVLLVSLLPASFVYIDYHEIGFIHNRVSGKTDTSKVYDYGCHLLAPQHTTLLFPATAQFVNLDLQVMNIDGLSISLSSSFQYFLRPSELSVLFRKYDKGYDRVIRNKAESTVKNAVTKLTLEELRLNRTLVEQNLFEALRLALSGDCCTGNSDKRFKLEQTKSTVASPCNAAKTCDQGQHVDVAYFQLGHLAIPGTIMSNYLKQITLQIEAERELHIQQSAVERKLTSLSVQNIENQAKEIREQAKANAKKIAKLSEAAKLLKVETSYTGSLNATFHRLGLDKEDKKLSLMFLKTLKDAKDNLIAFSYGYDKNTVYNP